MIGTTACRPEVGFTTPAVVFVWQYVVQSANAVSQSGRDASAAPVAPAVAG